MRQRSIESREIICCTLDARKSNIVKKFYEWNGKDLFSSKIQVWFLINYFFF